MKKTILVLLIAHGLFNTSPAQNAIDALRFSQLGFGGTARGVGIAGAVGSIGADFTALSDNPAGIGLYRSSEVMFTPSFVNINTRSDYRGTKLDDYRYNLNIGNIGYVTTGDASSGNWNSFSFGFGMNRLANFNRSTSFDATNNETTMLDQFKQDLNGSNFSQIDYGKFPFPTVLSYDAYLVNPNADSTSYSDVIGDKPVEQTGTITQRGGIDEYLLAAGGNYDDRIYWGATLGLPYIHYHQESSYQEKDVNDTIPDFQSFNLNRVSSTVGMGVNFKFGLIYRINDFVRLGGAVHSPSYYQLTDHYSSNITANFDTITRMAESPQGVYKYSLTTPWRLVGSASLVIHKMGFLSFDYEWLDYSQAYYSFDMDKSGTANSLLATKINETIQDKYTTAQNIRIGGELALDVFRIRAGYAMYSSPYKQYKGSFSQPGSMTAITFGAGIHQDDMFIDIAYSRNMTKDSQNIYNVDSAPNTALLNSNITNGAWVLTLGTKF